MEKPAIKVIDTPENMADFYRLTEKVYRNDPFYCPPFPDKVRQDVEREVFGNRQKIFMVYHGSETIGRVVARVSPTLTDDDGKPLGMLSFFEALNEPEAVRQLLGVAIDWIFARGATALIGPIDGDTWHRYRFNAGPFDARPFMMEPYNKPYYPELWTQCGFKVLSHYYSKHVADVRDVIPGMEKFYKRSLREGFSFRQFNADDFDGELHCLYKLSREIFSRNYLYTDICEKDFKDLYAGAKNILNPDLIWFAVDKDGEPAGFTFNVPDYFEALRSMKGKKNILAKIRFLLNKSTDTLNIKTLGTVPKYHGGGLGPALMYLAYSSGLKAGYRKANLCLIQEGNSSGRLDAGKGAVSRKYLLFRYVKGQHD